jgi:hypothetical protein
MRLDVYVHLEGHGVRLSLQSATESSWCRVNDVL